MNLVALALLPALTLSAPPPSGKRISVVLVPMDQGAEAATVKLESYMNEALEAYSNLNLKKTDDTFGTPKDENAEASLKRAETGYTESKSAYDSHDYEDAERKLRATLKEYEKAAPSLKSCGNLCETVAMYGAVLFKRGDADEAKIAVQDLIALNPTYELTTKKFDKEFISFRTQVATSSTAALRGNILLKSKPAGARVFLDGEFMGYAPITLQTLAIGKHLVRVERPGFKQYGQLVDVSPEDSDITAELIPTPQYKAFDSQLDKLAGEVSKDKPGSTMLALSKTMGLDRALVGTVKEISDNGSVEMMIGLYDLSGPGKKLASKKIAFQGDEYGQLKSEVIRVVNGLVNTVEGGEKVTKSADPLENKGGMEEWNTEDKGGKTTAEQKKKKNGKDPLDGVNGTEDW
ncbi:MAG: PEGA domain-containing protein [Myxococcaceae bacterium]